MEEEEEAKMRKGRGREREGIALREKEKAASVAINPPTFRREERERTRERQGLPRKNVTNFIGPVFCDQRPNWGVQMKSVLDRIEWLLSPPKVLFHITYNAI